MTFKCDYSLNYFIFNDHTKIIFDTCIKHQIENFCVHLNNQEDFCLVNALKKGDLQLSETTV